MPVSGLPSASLSTPLTFTRGGTDAWHGSVPLAHWELAGMTTVSNKQETASTFTTKFIVAPRRTRRFGFASCRSQALDVLYRHSDDSKLRAHFQSVKYLFDRSQQKQARIKSEIES